MELYIPTTFNLITAGLCLFMGIVVLARNPRKLTHQGFFLLSLNLMLWALCVVLVINSTSQGQAWFWVVAAEIVACFLPATCYHFAGYFPRGHFEGNRIVAVALYLAALVFVFLAPSELYVKEVRYTPGLPPENIHGPAFSFFLVLIVVSLVGVHTNLRRKMRRAEGQSRRQAQFVMFGIYCIAGFGIVINVASEIFKISLFQAYGPISTVLVMAIFAYAMVRFHLLDTPVLVSRILVMAVAAVFVGCVFVPFVYGLAWITGGHVDPGQFVPIVLGSFIVSLTLPRFKARTRALIEGSFLKKPYDINALYRRIAREASEDVQLESLLENVANHIQSTIGVRSIRVLLVDENDPEKLHTEFTTIENDTLVETREHGTLLEYLRQHPEPLMLEKVLHLATSEAMMRIANHLAELDAYVCLPLRTSGGLVGILTLGQKTAHEVFSEEELIAFHALVGPLGTAIANARLYREVEKVNLHLSRVLGQMREGVVAVDSQGVITTINDAAAKVLGQVKEGEHLEVLPEEMAHVLSAALKHQRSVNDFETTLPATEDRPTPVLMSVSYMQSPAQESAGAVALFYDLSQIKRLEDNVLRADRLSSIGVLAAGMAHEIKNPLVSIKTFSQLLLKRYEDPDFRSTFEETVPGEVDRINSIVSRLLEFAKPRPVVFEANSVQTVIEGVLNLVENQAREAGVEIKLHRFSGDAEVYGDEQLLHQVFLNLILNSIDAMDEVEEARLEVRIERGHFHFRKHGTRSLIETECVRTVITDTGCGIAEEHMHDLFTPFFTTKAEGSGLGLSVVHSIVSEHGGEIEVNSVPERGTSFHIVLPAAQSENEDEAVDRDRIDDWVPANVVEAE